MKKVYLLFNLLLINSLYLSAQKVDLDREYIKVEYINLPTHPIPEAEKKTFSFTSNVPKADDEVVLYGFDRIEYDGNIDVSLHFENIYPNEIEIKEEKHQKKNKEGEVIRTWYTYDAILTYKTKGNVAYQSVMDSKRTYSIGGIKKHTKTFRKNKEASNYARNNLNIFADKFQKEFIDEEIKNLKNFLNRRFGYEDWWHKELFWILDSESNPEYAGHKKALEDIKDIFSKIKIDSNVKDLAPEVKKVEDYFNSIIPKYPKDKRKHRKMRYASYYNIAKLYFTIENFEKAEEYAQKIIDNRYDRSDGKKLIKKITRLKELFKKNNTNTRHFKTETTDSREPINNTEVVIIEKEPIKEVKPITELPLTGNSEIDNQKIKKLLDELELLQIINTKRISPFKGKYLKKDGTIYGKQLHSSTNSDLRYDTIFIVKFNNKVLGTKFRGYESNFVFNKSNELEQLKNKYSSSESISTTKTISRNKYSKISKVKTYNEEDFSRVLNTANITYKDENIESILIDMHRRHDDKELLKIIENTNNKLVTSLKSFNAQRTEDETFIEYKLINPLEVFFSRKTTYKKDKPSLKTERCIYTDFNWVLKREESHEYTSRKSNEKVASKDTHTYKFDNKKLIQKIATTKNITHPHYSFKYIYNYADLNSNTSAPEYEWRRGSYKFNHQDELVNIKRDGKYKEKKDGIWSDWKWVPY